MLDPDVLDHEQKQKEEEELPEVSKREADPDRDFVAKNDPRGAHEQGVGVAEEAGDVAVHSEVVEKSSGKKWNQQKC